MTDEDALLAVVKSNPEALAPRRMLSDLYREMGDEEKADLWAIRPHLQSPFASLVGQTVKGLWLNEDTTHLNIKVSDGRWFRYELSADCCSESWWYRIRGVRYLLGETVCAVAEGRLEGVDVQDGLGRQEVDEAYEFTLLTKAGACEVCFRNSSNGYYGGWIEVLRDRGQPVEMGKPITSDWTYRPPQTPQAGGHPPACDCNRCLFPVN